LLLRIVFVVVCFGLSGVSLAGAENATGVERFLFDIPAQDLRDALFVYAGTTGLSVLVDDGMTAKVRSAEVKGRFTAEDALKILLNGTGLDFQSTSANAFTLVPAVGTTLTQTSSSDDSHYESYFRAVQTAVKRALCGRAQTLPGQYRVVIQLWIDESGVVARSSLLGSTGDRDRDQALLERMNGMPVGQGPPRGLPEPVTLVVLPRSPKVSQDCDPTDGNAPATAGN
jgi:TonB family protein